MFQSDSAPPAPDATVEWRENRFCRDRAGIPALTCQNRLWPRSSVGLGPQRDGYEPKRRQRHHALAVGQAFRRRDARRHTADELHDHPSHHIPYRTISMKAPGSLIASSNPRHAPHLKRYHPCNLGTSSPPSVKCGHPARSDGHAIGGLPVRILRSPSSLNLLIVIGNLDE
jgi:hypothetical protein